MDYENFLMNLYFGSLDAELFDSFQEFKADETTRGFIQNYFEVNSEYPPSVLEEKGMVPSELLEKLGRNDFFGLTIPRQYGGVGLSLQQYSAYRRIAGQQKHVPGDSGTCASVYRD